MELWDLADGIGEYPEPVSFKDFCEAADEFSELLIEGGKPDNLIKMYWVHQILPPPDETNSSEVRSTKFLPNGMESSGDTTGAFYESLQFIEGMIRDYPGRITYIECGVRKDDGGYAVMAWGVECKDVSLYDYELYGADNPLFYNENIRALKESYAKYGITPGTYHNDFLIRVKGLYHGLEVLSKEEAFTQERSVSISDWRYYINPIAFKNTRSFKELKSAGVSKIEFMKDSFSERFRDLSDDYSKEEVMLLIAEEAKRIDKGENSAYELVRMLKFGEYPVNENVDQMLWGQNNLECRKEVLSVFVDIVVDMLKKCKGFEEPACENIEYVKSEDGRDIVFYNLLGAKFSVLDELNIQCNFTDVLKCYGLLPGENNLSALEEKKNYLLSLDGRELINEVRNILSYMGIRYYEIETLDGELSKCLYNDDEAGKSLALAEELRTIVLAGISQAIRNNKEDDAILLDYLLKEFYEYCDWECSYSNTSISKSELKLLIAKRLFSEYKNKKGVNELLRLSRYYHDNGSWDRLRESITMTDEYLAPDDEAGRPKCSEVSNSSFWEYYYYQCTADLNDVHWEGVIRMSTYYSGGWD